MIRLIVAAYLGLSLDLYQRMSIAPASVTALLLGDRIPHLIKLADSGSLEDLRMRLAKTPTNAARRKAAEGAQGADGRSPEAYGGGPKPGADGRGRARAATPRNSKR